MGLLLALAVSAAQAQYKVVGPDGRVTYTDQAPPGATVQSLRGGAVMAGSIGGGAGVNLAQLPYELRDIAKRYPVMLVTGDQCVPCDQGRASLQQRGVPFVERTARSRDDLAALRQQEGGTDLPLLRVGGQRLKGYDSAEWSSYLDAAGYPKTSTLPARYAPPAVQPYAGVPSAKPAEVKGTASVAPSTPAARTPDAAPPPVSASGAALPGFRF